MQGSDFNVAITATDKTKPGVAQARKSIVEGLKGSGQPAITTTKAAVDQTDKATRAWREFGTVFRDLPRQFKNYYHTGGMGRVVDEFSILRRNVDSAATALSRAAPAIGVLGGALGAAGIIEMTKGAADYSMTLANAAMPLGMATARLQQWQYVAQRAGISASDVTSAFSALNQEIQGAAYRGDVGAIGIFKQMGIAASQGGRARTVEQMLPQIFRYFKAQRDPGVRFNLLRQLGLGSLFPLFERAPNWGDLQKQLGGAKQHGLIDPETQQRLDKLYQSWTNLDQAARGFGNALSTELQPALTPVLDAMTHWLDQNRDNKTVLDGVAVAAVGLGTAMSAGLLKSIVAIAGGLRAIAAAGTAAAAGENAAAASATALAATPAIGKLRGLLFGATLGMGALAASEAPAAAFDPTSEYNKKKRAAITGAADKATGGWFSSIFGLPGRLHDRLFGPAAPVPKSALGPQSAISDPLKRGFLNALAVGEGGALGYHALYGGGSVADLSRFPSWSGRMGPAGISHAAGRYQFEPATWRDEAARLGLKDFSPASQDAAAWDIASRTYAQKTGRSLLADLRSGDSTRVGAALHSTWTSTGAAFDKRLALDTSPLMQAASSHHQVEVSFLNAPAGFRTGLRSAKGPADFGMRVEYAMAAPS